MPMGINGGDSMSISINKKNMILASEEINKPGNTQGIFRGSETNVNIKCRNLQFL